MTDLVRRVAGARKRVNDSERALRVAIVAAFEDRSAGHTVEDIADAAGLTKQRIYQIVNEAGARERTTATSPKGRQT